MFDFLLQQWTRIVRQQFQAPLPALEDIARSQSGSGTNDNVNTTADAIPPSPPVLPITSELTLSTISQYCDIFSGHLKSLPMAVAFLTLLRDLPRPTITTTFSLSTTSSSASKAISTPNSNISHPRIEQFFQTATRLVQLCEQMKISQRSFNEHNKHVIIFEGLSNVGKSTTIHFLKECIGEHLYCPNSTSSFANNGNIQPTTTNSGTNQNTAIHNNNNAASSITINNNNDIKLLQDIQILYQYRDELIDLLSMDFLLIKQYNEIKYLIKQLIDFIFLYFLSIEILLNDNYSIFLLEGFYHQHIIKIVEETRIMAMKKNNKSTSSQFTDNYGLKDFSSAAMTWPHDLPMPELVLFLTTSSDIRLQRMGIPSNTATINDRQQIAIMDNYLQTIYTSIRGPGTVGIDTTPDIEEVYGTVVEALDYYGVYSITRSTAPAIPPTAYSPVPPTSTVITSEDFNPYAAYASTDYNYLNSQQDTQSVYIPPSSTDDMDLMDNLLDANHALYLACNFEDVHTPIRSNQDRNEDNQYNVNNKRRKVDEGFLDRPTTALESFDESRNNVDTNRRKTTNKHRGRDSLLVIAENPVLSNREINERRVSMGVYDMFMKKF